MENDYVKNYYAAYGEMKKAAIEKMKNYGKTLEVYEICKQKLMESEGYESVDEIDEDELDDFLCYNTYSCFFEDKHGFIYDAHIVMVRYTDEREIEVYLESDGGGLADWVPANWISGDKDSVWLTILEFAK